MSVSVCFKIQEAESKPQCRRLQLKDIIPIEMQRLTKYPLLLENIAKSTGECLQSNWLTYSVRNVDTTFHHITYTLHVIMRHIFWKISRLSLY